MRIYVEKWKSIFRDKKFVYSLIAAFLFLAISLLVNYFAGTYATKRASSAVGDIILSNIPVFDVDILFNYGPIVFWIFMAMLLLGNPKKMSFTLKSIALFVIIRAVFISLTHLGPFPTQQIVDNGDFLNKITFSGDLFFSGHTGLPFLMALVFWENKHLRYLFLGASVFFATVVLLGHYHYSIDVLGAFFITYSIFHMAEFFFKKDRKLFLDDQLS
jgi:hypothetical protein